MPFRHQQQRPSSAPTSSPGRWLLLLLLAGCSGSLPAAEILLVLGGEQKPYEQAADAVASALEHAGHTTRRVLAEQAVAPAVPVVLIGSPAVQWARTRALVVPTAYCLVSEAVAATLHDRPRLGGVSIDIPLPQQTALMAEALPQARSVGMLVRSGSERSRQQAEQLKAALPAGWTLTTVTCDPEVGTAEALDDLLGRRLDLVWTSTEGGLYNEATVRTLLLGALRRRLPVFGYSPAFVRAGALLGVGVDPAAQGRQAAQVLQRLLGGEAGPLRIVPEYEVAVNQIVADKLHLELPAAVVVRAGQVVGEGR